MSTQTSRSVVPPAHLNGAAPARQAQPAVEDPSINEQDGSRSIEIITMLGDSVIDVRHLSDPSAGKVKPMTWCMLVLGWAAFGVGFILSLVGQQGVGLMALAAGLSLGLFGVIQAREERRSPDYIVGESQDADLHTASGDVPTPRFPIVQSSGSDYVINVAARMRGEMTLDGHRYSMEDLVDAGRAHHAVKLPGTVSCRIPHLSSFALTCGDNTFLVRSVDPARRVSGAFLANTDWSSQAFTGASVGLHTLILALVFSMPPDAKLLGQDLFGQEFRLVKVSMTPTEQDRDETPAWLRKTREEAGPAGKAHRGLEGKMGSKKSTQKNKRFAIKGKKDNQDVHLARKLALDSARKAGVLGLLGSRSGGHLASIFGRESAIGRDAQDALGGLIGDEIGESYGIGGLGISGTGRYGGGDGEGTVGVCRGSACYGKIGHSLRHGNGGGGDGWKKKLRKHRAGTPEARPGPVKVLGGLDKELIRRTIRRHLNEVKYCYAKELQANPNLGGRVVVKFSIASTGKVVISRIKSSTIASYSVGTCINSAVRRWTFPRPQGNGIVVVTYPFMLRSAGSAR